MAPEQDRAFLAVEAGSPNIQVETIFAELLPAAEWKNLQKVGRQAEHILGLDRHVAVGHRLAHSAPRNDILRRLPAQLAQRWRGIGNALETADAAVTGPAHAPAYCLDNDFRHARF